MNPFGFVNWHGVNAGFIAICWAVVLALAIAVLVLHGQDHAPAHAVHTIPLAH